MSNRCIHCGFAGTNDQLMDHAGSCPVMTGDQQPMEEKTETRYFPGCYDLSRHTIDDILHQSEITVARCKDECNVCIVGCKTRRKPIRATITYRIEVQK